MTQQEMDTILAEIETRFPGLEVNGKMEMQADYKNKTFTEEGTIAVWSEGHCISVLHSRKAFDALINVARIMSQGQLETIGTHQGECIECERVSVLSDASNLCEACVLDAQVDDPNSLINESVPEYQMKSFDF